MKKSTIALVLGAFLLQGSVSLRAQRTSGSGSVVITEASVRGHLEFLASDALNGRGSGTRDEWIAAAYIAAQLRRWGIEPLGDNGGYIQQVDVELSEASAPPVLAYEGGRLTHGKEMVVQTLGAPRTSGPLQKFQPGVPARPGAVVLLPEALPPNPFDATAGASAVIIADSPRLHGLWDTAASGLPALPGQLKETTPSSQPTVIVLTKASYAAIAALAEGATIAIAAEVKAPRVTHTWNVLGKITGRDRRRAAEVILLTAHLDHLGNQLARAGGSSGDTIYNGADDDASGSVAVLELAEALAKGRRPKRTIIFTWFGSEESGGYGAGHFLRHPPVPLDSMVANLEFEMIGRPDAAVPPHTLWLTGYERTDLGPRLAKEGARIVQDPHPAENFFMRSDNFQLALRGIVAQTVSSFGLHKEYHQPSDEVRLVDFPHMTDAIRSMLAPVRWLANSTYKPSWLPGKKP